MRNHIQDSLHSDSTIAKANGNNPLLASTPTAVNKVPLYLPNKKVPSIFKTGRQKFHPEIDGPKAQNTR